MKDSKPMSILAIAEWIGCDRNRLAGSIKAVGPADTSGRYPLYDLQAVLRHRFKELGKAAGGRSTDLDMSEDSDATINPAVEKAKLTRKQREKLEIEIDKKKGLLISGETVAEQWNKVLYAAKAKFLGIGARLAPVLPVEEDPHRIKEMIDDACREALNELTEKEI